ncbi:hypothetical protein ACEPAI_8436 [Sanghuangporus weigelae]
MSARVIGRLNEYPAILDLAWAEHRCLDQQSAAIGPLSLMPSGVDLVLMAGLILVFFGIVFRFFISRAPRSVAAQSESILKDGADEPCRSAIKWPVLLCIPPTFILGRVSVSSGLFEEMADTIIFIVALAAVAFSSVKLIYASSNAAQHQGPFHTRTGSSSVDMLSESPVIDLKFAVKEVKANGECKDSAVSRSDSAKSRGASPFAFAIGNELATIDMKTRANAAASTMERDKGMFAEFPSASIPLRNENDKLASLVTTRLKDDNICGTMTPEMDSGMGSSEASPLAGHEDAGTIPPPSLPPFDVVEDPASGSLPSTARSRRRERSLTLVVRLPLNITPRSSTIVIPAPGMSFRNTEPSWMAHRRSPDEAATIDTKMVANATACTTDRKAGMSAELIPASIPLRRNEDELASSGTTPPEGEDT